MGREEQRGSPPREADLTRQVGADRDSTHVSRGRGRTLHDWVWGDTTWEQGAFCGGGDD